MTERVGVAPMLVHATAVVVAETGILIRGPSGAGKTSLALALVAASRAAARFGRLVADDTVALSASSGRVVARPHPRTAGLAERRGLGIDAIEHEPAAVIRIVADLAAAADGAPPPSRMPEPHERKVTLLGVSLPRVRLVQDAAVSDNAVRLLDHCGRFRPGS